jgi:hypothetical protein
MPGYDRTGPWGQGPRSGGGFGFCGTPAQDSETDPRGYGRGFGPGGGSGLQRGFRRGSCFFGRGRNAVGFGPRWAAERIQPEPAKPSLEAEAADLRRRLEAIEQRLAGMEGRGAEPKEI